MLRRMTGKGLSTRSLLDGDKKSKKKHDAPANLSNEEVERVYGLKDLPSAQRSKVNQLIDLLATIRSCNKAKNLDEAIEIIIQSTCKIVGCDRATLFMVSF